MPALYTGALQINRADDPFLCKNAKLRFQRHTATSVSDNLAVVAERSQAVTTNDECFIDDAGSSETRYDR